MQKRLQCPTCDQTEIHSAGQPRTVIKQGDDRCQTPVESWNEIAPPGSHTDAIKPRRAVRA